MTENFDKLIEARWEAFDDSVNRIISTNSEGQILELLKLWRDALSIDPDNTQNQAARLQSIISSLERKFYQ